jgi:hypothetical protein
LKTQPLEDEKDGGIRLRGVGFPADPDPRPTWDFKTTEAKIAVEIEAELPDGSTVTGRAFLGTDVNLNRNIQRLTPLYDAGALVNEDRRFGSRTDVDPGGDGWGTVGTFSFLTSASSDFVVFNDVSLEHGGRFPKVPRATLDRDFHQKHQCGTSVDTRYFGPRGMIGDIDLNDLNGLPGENDQGTARLRVLQRAEGGEVNAQQAIVQWILTNRARMDQMARSDSIRWFGIGSEQWNTFSLLQGLYPNGTPICCDPETGQNIGPWAGPGRNRINDDLPNHLIKPCPH